jgi:hypothetical protein
MTTLKRIGRVDLGRSVAMTPSLAGLWQLRGRGRKG